MRWFTTERGLHLVQANSVMELCKILSQPAALERIWAYIPQAVNATLRCTGSAIRAIISSYSTARIGAACAISHQSLLPLPQFQYNGACVIHTKDGQLIPCSPDGYGEALAESTYLLDHNDEKGWGVHTKRVISSGEEIGSYAGEIVHTSILHKRRVDYDAAGQNYVLTVREILPVRSVGLALSILGGCRALNFVTQLGWICLAYERRCDTHGEHHAVLQP